ncbi:MAG TPA: hypothetical protein VNF50_13880 [Acidimicrobiales bacterium]|nr:hypothetical protein [Acidimicrobiales bacterium]
MLADLLGTLSVIVIVTEALGTFGQFRFPGLAGTCWGVCVLVLAWRRRTTRRAAPPMPIADDDGLPSTDRSMRLTDAVIVASAAGLLAAQWSGWVAQAVDVGIGGGGGPGNGDSLWYHMPFAATFVQSGWTSRLQFVNAEALVTYYPANTSLLHAVGMLTLHSDFLSVFLNFALVPVALLAGWCIGSGRRFGAATLAGVSVALALPIVAASEAGTAKDDVLGLVGLVAAVAFVVHPRAVAEVQSRRAAAWVGGMSAGLALGSKLTLVVPIVALGLSLFFLSPRGERRPTILRWATGVASTGGYWYARNLLRVGNPIPGLHLGIGPLQLPRPATPSMDLYGQNLFHNLGSATVWKLGLLPGLKSAFGDSWPLVLGILAVACVLGLIRLRGQSLVPVIVTLCAGLGFLITPGTVWGPQYIHEPDAAGVTAGLFAFNLRYLLPAIAVGLAVVPLAVGGWRYGRVVIAAFIGVTLLSTQLGALGQGGWSGGHAGVAILIGLGSAVLAGALAWSSGTPPGATGRDKAPRRGGTWAVAGGGAIAVAAVLWPVQVAYRQDRFASMPLAQWAARVAPARIGYSGFVFSYPLYGPSLQNSVTMIGQHGPDGAWHAVRTCRAWQRLIHQDRLQYVLVPVGGPSPIVGIDLARWKLGQPGGSPPEEPPESSWTRSAPGVRPVFVGWGVAAYSISPRIKGYACPRST